MTPLAICHCSFEQKLLYLVGGPRLLAGKTARVFVAQGNLLPI
jgi:hypothetical protein